MEGHLEVRILQVQGGEEIILLDSVQDGGYCLHLEGCLSNEGVQSRQVDHGAPASSRLFHQEEAAVEARARIGNDLQRSFGQHLLYLLMERQRLRRSWAVSRKQHRCSGEGRRGLEREPVSVPKDGHGPRVRPNCLPAPPVH